MVNKTKQLSYWQGKFGDDYVGRNSNFEMFKKRSAFFAEILRQCKKVHSILEVGPNIGGNLITFNSINPLLKLTGIEPNSKAAKIARKLVPNASIVNGTIFDAEYVEKFDLVFTSGVLIHIADDELPFALDKIYSASKEFILTVEYHAAQRQLVTYRGLDDALFKRPYQDEWHRQFPSLKLVSTGYLTKEQGFDNSHWWLFKKI